VELTIDKAGRVVIPKKVRDDLNLRAGDVLELEQEGGALQLRPVRAKVPMRKRKGRWVFNSGLGNWDIDAAINESREDRMREILK
jgi:AbrB family looped-hinge helix DNA binding protein